MDEMMFGRGAGEENVERYRPQVVAEPDSVSAVVCEDCGYAVRRRGEEGF